MKEGIICGVFMFFFFWFCPLIAVFMFEGLPTFNVMFLKIVSPDYIVKHYDMFLFNFLVSIAFGYSVYSTKKNRG